MRQISLDNKKLYKLLMDKDVLLKEGYAITVEIELLEKDIKDFEDKEKEITIKVEPKEKIDAGNKLKEEINAKLKELEKLGHEIEQEKLDAIPKDMKDKHIALLKKKEARERDRNKVALKIQKIKDRLVPLVQKDIKPLLTEYEDIETANLNREQGTVDIKIFDYVENFKETFRKKDK